MADGIDAVQITTLSKSLSRDPRQLLLALGKPRSAACSALIAEWRAKNSGTMAAGAGKVGILAGRHSRPYLPSGWTMRNLTRRLIRRFATGPEDHLMYSSIVEKEDENRVAAIAAMFERFGFDETEAFIRARVIYFTQLSYYALNIDEPLAKRASYLSAYYRVLHRPGYQGSGCMTISSDRVGAMVTSRRRQMDLQARR